MDPNYPQPPAGRRIDTFFIFGYTSDASQPVSSSPWFSSLFEVTISHPTDSPSQFPRVPAVIFRRVIGRHTSGSLSLTPRSYTPANFQFSHLRGRSLSRAETIRAFLHYLHSHPNLTSTIEDAYRLMEPATRLLPLDVPVPCRLNLVPPGHVDTPHWDRPLFTLRSEFGLSEITMNPQTNV
ncbi:hypothetical protein HDU67_005804, partial [Dinochytrium kinnereticum]